MYPSRDLWLHPNQIRERRPSGYTHDDARNLRALRAVRILFLPAAVLSGTVATGEA